METEPTSSPPSPPPIKSLPPPAAVAAAPSPSKTSLTDQIPTPERPIQPPRCVRNRGIAFSLTEVKKIAMGLNKPQKTPAADQSDDELLSVEQQLNLIPSSASSPSKPRRHAKLPKKYEGLIEFFNSLLCSVRLIRLKGLMTTFSSICAGIQNLTDRRFTYIHLAQLKFILPEAILIKKVLVRDESTCCMKAELQITLRTDTVGSSTKREGESGYSILRKIFRARVEEFSKEHPEGDDIPEEALPHPFNQKILDIPSVSASVSNDSSVKSSINIVSQQQLTVPSHMPRSFQMRFSQKTPIPPAEKTPLMCPNQKSPKKDSSVSTVPSLKSNTKRPFSQESLCDSPASLTSGTCRAHDEEFEGLMIIDDSAPKETQILEGTPAKLISTPARLMTATPEIQTPKRYRPTAGCDSPELEKSVRRSARAKLFLTPRKNEKNEDIEIEIRSSQEDDAVNFLPESIVQMIREKEKKALQEREAGAADAKRRQKMTASLSKLVDVILLIFQSSNRSFITKQELYHKIISSDCSIEDKYEVEEKLKTIEELVPDWLSRKMAFGDFLYSINKSSDLQEVRRKLAEVN